MQKIKKCSKLSWANEGVCWPNEISFWCLILVWARVAEVKIADFWRPLKYLDLVHQPHISNFAKERSFFHIFYSAPQQHSRTALFFLVPYSLWNSGTADICRMLGQKNYICLDFVFQFIFFCGATSTLAWTLLRTFQNSTFFLVTYFLWNSGTADIGLW